MMKSFESVLALAAPFIGSVLGGPLGGVGGKLLGKCLLGDENAKLDDVKEALLSASPELLFKLKALDQDYQYRIMQLDLDVQNEEDADRANARASAIERHDRFPAFLALMITFGFLGVLIVVMVVPIPVVSNSIVHIMFGTLATAWVSCISYYFGSSKASLVKTHMLSK